MVAQAWRRQCGHPPPGGDNDEIFRGGNAELHARVDRLGKGLLGVGPQPAENNRGAQRILIFAVPLATHGQQHTGLDKR